MELSILGARCPSGNDGDALNEAADLCRKDGKGLVSLDPSQVWETYETVDLRGIGYVNLAGRIRCNAEVAIPTVLIGGTDERTLRRPFISLDVFRYGRGYDFSDAGSEGIRVL